MQRAEQGSILLRPVTRREQKVFKTGAGVIKDRISHEKITPLATHGDIVELRREGRAVRKLIDYVFDAVETIDWGDIPDPGAFTVIRTRYRGANGKEYEPLPKYLPHQVAAEVEAMQTDYDLYREAHPLDGPTRPGLIVESGYRSPAYQAAVMAVGIGERGVERTSASMKLPGTSQHADRFNVAIDLTNIGDRNGRIPQPDGTHFGFERTPEFRWLLEHSPEYGLWLPYHPDPASPTSDIRSDGVLVEPWHFQYMNGAAAELTQQYNVVPLFEEFIASKIAA